MRSYLVQISLARDHFCFFDIHRLLSLFVDIKLLILVRYNGTLFVKTLFLSDISVHFLNSKRCPVKKDTEASMCLIFCSPIPGLQYQGANTIIHFLGPPTNSWRK